MTEDILYIRDCLDEIAANSETTIGEEGFPSLYAAFIALKENEWLDAKALPPELLPGNEGRRSIPCLVAAEPPHALRNRKLFVTVACRRLVKSSNGKPFDWEWGRGLKVIKWRPVPEVD